MKKHNSIKKITILTAAALIGLGTYAFGDWEGGYGHHMRGYGMGMMDDDYGPGMGYGRHMGPGMGRDWRGRDRAYENDEVLSSLNKEREAFWKETEGLRSDIYQKQLELESELAKQSPDVEKAKKIQGEIQAFKNDLAQKRLDHQIKMRKINPNAGRGFMGRHGRGMGFGRGGFCWR